MREIHIIQKWGIFLTFTINKKNKKEGFKKDYTDIRHWVISYNNIQLSLHSLPF